MWLITQHGFYNVVKHPEDPTNVMTIKGRRREDMEAVKKIIPYIQIDESHKHDYRFRAKADRIDVVNWIGLMANEIDYPKTKPQLSKMTPGRDGMHLDVWATMLELQEE